MSDKHYDAARDARPRRSASSTCSPAAGPRSRTRMAKAPGWAAPARGRRSGIRHLARGARQAAGAAQVRAQRLQAKSPPLRRLQRTSPAGALARIFMSPGPIFEPEGAARTGGARRARCSPPACARATSCTTASPITSPRAAWILDSGARALGCAVIPAGPGKTEQQLDVIAVPEAHGLRRHARLPEDPARQGQGSRQGRLLASSKALVGGAALFPSLRAEYKARGIDAYQSYATADLGIIAYESPALRGHDRRRGRDRGDRAAGHRRSGAAGRGRRGRRHHVQPRLSDDPLRHRRSLRGAAGTEPVRAHQHAHQGLDGPRRPDHQGQGHVRASRAGRRGGQAPCRPRTRAPRGGARRASRTP